jgi:hypothetical protein
MSKIYKLNQFIKGGDFFLFELTEEQDSLYEMGSLLATTDELFQFGDILKLDKEDIIRVLESSKKYFGTNWYVALKTKIICKNVECDGSCLECNQMIQTINTDNKTIKIGVIL